MQTTFVDIGPKLYRADLQGSTVSPVNSSQSSHVSGLPDQCGDLAAVTLSLWSVSPVATPPPLEFLKGLLCDARHIVLVHGKRGDVASWRPCIAAGVRRSGRPCLKADSAREKPFPPCRKPTGSAQNGPEVWMSSPSVRVTGGPQPQAVLHGPATAKGTITQCQPDNNRWKLRLGTSDFLWARWILMPFLVFPSVLGWVQNLTKMYIKKKN